MFHDCLEDVSMFFNLYKITDFQGIFDTQIAHRMCFDELYHNQLGKQSSISLAMLLKEYLNVDYEIKGEIHSLMGQNPYLWKQRPISDKLNYYAGKDVYYLPRIYEIISCKCLNGEFNTLSLEQIFEECKKYLNYVTINLNIKNFNKTNLKKSSIVQGIIK